MPSEEWKIRNFKQKWFAGETISVGIGQGAVAATPVQLTASDRSDFHGRTDGRAARRRSRPALPRISAKSIDYTEVKNDSD